jgi:hypothetical protein
VSRSWPRRLRVAVAPDGVALLLLEGLRPRVVHHFASACGSAASRGWGEPIEHLEEQLAARDYSARGVSVTLSNHWCRYLLLTDTAALSNTSELKAYAQHKLRAAFGDDVAQWEVSVSRHNEALLVCAVERAGIDALTALFARHRLPVTSIEPFFASAFNRFRRRIGRRSGWFVAQESGGVTVGRLENGRWSALASRRTPADTAQALHSTLERERILQDCEAHERVWLASTVRRYVASDFAGFGYEVIPLDAALPKNMNIDDEHRYAMAA